MAVNSRELGLITIWTVSVFTLGLMVANTLASIRMTRNMATVSTRGLMVASTVAAGPKGNSMASAFTKLKTARRSMGFGRKAKGSSGLTKFKSNRF